VRLVAVTSCPTGIAHTYMAAESLEQSARAAGHDIVVETQGAIAWEPLSPETIAAADAVIIAADVQIRDRERFTGKPVVTVGVRRAITDAPGLLDQAGYRVEKVKTPIAPGSKSWLLNRITRRRLEHLLVGGRDAGREDAVALVSRRDGVRARGER